MRLVVACIRVKRIFDFTGGRSLSMMPRAEEGSPALGANGPNCGSDA